MNRHRTLRKAGVHLLAVVMCAASTVSIIAGPAAAAGSKPIAAGLTVEGVAGALGIDTPAPRLGWQISSAQRGVTQSAYQIRVDNPAGEELWDSGRVASAESTQVPYGGPALTSATRYHWRVRVWDAAGRASAWSDPSWWETGLLRASDWSAKWIGRDVPSASWSDYTLDVRLTVVRDAAGIFFRARGVNDAYIRR